MGVVRNIMVRAVADFSSLQQASQELQNNMNRMSNNVSGSINRMNRETGKLGAIGSAFASLRNELAMYAGVYLGVKGMADATKAAYEYEAEMGNLTHVLQDQTQAFVEWGDTQAREFGYGRSDVVKYGTQYANLVSTFTHGTEQISQRTKTLLEMSAIIANGTGRSIDDVMQRMRSGLLGNVEAINDLGIYANNSMIQTTNAFKQIANGRHWANLTFQEQQQIMYMGLMEQAVQKYGNTMQQNTHLKLNQFLGIMKDIRVEMGNFILPILNRVLPALNALGMALLRAMTIAAQFSKALFGKAVWGDTPQTKVQTGAINDQSGAVNNLTHAVKKLKKAKQDAMSLAGFDQINLLNNGSSSSPDGGGSSSGMALPTPDTSGFNDAINQTTDNVGKVSQAVEDFANKVKVWLKPLKPYWDDLTDAVKGLWDSIVNLWESKGVQAFVGWLSDTAKLAIEVTLHALSQTIKTVSDAINVVADILNGDWSKAWEDANKMLGDATDIFGGLTPIIAGITAALIAQKVVETVTELWKSYKLITEEMTIAQWALNVAMDANPIGLVAAAIGLLVTAALELYTHWNDINGAFKKFGDMISSGYNTAIDGITTALKDQITAVFGKVGGKYVWDGLGSIANGLKSIGNGNFKKGFDSIVTGTKTLLNGVFGRAKGKYIWEGLGDIKNGLKNIATGNFKKGFDNIKDGIHNFVNALFGKSKGKFVWEGISKIVSALKDIKNGNFGSAVQKIKDAFKNFGHGLGEGITNTFKSVYNKAVGGINSIIKSFNKVKDSLPFGVGDSIKDVPTIPTLKLAKGGITTGPTMALVGDNSGGQEVVQPLNKLQDYMSGTITDAIATAMKLSGGTTGGSSDRPIEITLQLNETKLGKAVISSINKVHRQSGKVLLNL